MNVAYTIDLSLKCGVGRVVFLKKKTTKTKAYFVLFHRICLFFIVNVEHLLCVSLNPIQLNVILDMPHRPQGLLIDN